MKKYRLPLKTQNIQIIFYIVVLAAAIFFIANLIGKCNPDKASRETEVADTNSLNILSENEQGFFIDTRDGRKYKSVTIGSQTWMAENLVYLPDVCKSDFEQNGCGYWVYGYEGVVVKKAKETANFADYGVLYSWQKAQNACPDGWHLPDDEEWKILEQSIGMTKKQADTLGWRGPDNVISLTDSGKTGFNLVLGGYRNFNSGYYSLDTMGSFWLKSETKDEKAPFRSFYINYNGIYRNTADKNFGFSVRCVKND